MTYGQRLEEMGQMPPKFGSKDNNENRTKHLFDTFGSHGANNERLAQLLSAFDFAMSLLGWDKETEIEIDGKKVTVPPVSLSSIITGYQASVDTKYHDDYKSVATIEELDARMAKRRTQQNQPNNGGIV